MTKSIPSLLFYIILVTCFNLLNIAQIECFNMTKTKFNKIHEYNPNQRYQERRNMKFGADFPISSIIITPAKQLSKHSKAKETDSFANNASSMIWLYKILFGDQDVSILDFRSSPKPRFCYVFGICSHLFCECN